MAPCLIGGRVLLVLGAAHTNCITLCVQGSSSEQKLPVKRTCYEIKASWINQHPSPFLIHQQPQLCKSQIIADAQSKPTVFCVENTNLLPRSEGFALFIGDFTCIKSITYPECQCQKGESCPFLFVTILLD